MQMEQSVEVINLTAADIFGIYQPIYKIESNICVLYFKGLSVVHLSSYNLYDLPKQYHMGHSPQNDGV